MARYIRKVSTTTVTYETVKFYGKKNPIYIDKEKDPNDVCSIQDGKAVIAEIEPWREMTDLECKLFEADND